MTDYTLVRSRRRTLSMELKRDGTVVVHAPLRLGVEKIDAFVAAHEAWLAKRVFAPVIFTQNALPRIPSRQRPSAKRSLRARGPSCRSAWRIGAA